VEIGKDWRAKDVTVDQEHLASNTLREGLAQFHAELPRKESNGLKAICACPEGELHDVAIRCVGYYLETEGWNVLFLGQSSPIESLVAAIKMHKPNLVALSSLAPNGDRSLIRAVNKYIYPVTHRMKAQLAIGGPGVKARWAGKVKAEFLCDRINESEVFANPNLYAVRN
jgi:methanogenic corrinoid protein MtbC1